MVERLVHGGQHQHVEERGNALSDDCTPELQCSENLKKLIHSQIILKFKQILEDAG
jgi:hypothetical protein